MSKTVVVTQDVVKVISVGGVGPAAALPADVALTDAANEFTQVQTLDAGASFYGPITIHNGPSLKFQADTSGNVYGQGTGSFAHVNVVNDVTAASFTGDGSGLTNIPDTALSKKVSAAIAMAALARA